MTNIIYHSITDDASVSSCSSPDHNLHSSSHQVQSDQNLGTSQLNVDTLSLYSVIGKACFACTRPSPELSNDNNSTISIGNGTVNTEIHVSSDSNRNLSLTSVIRDSPSNFKIFCFKELSKIMSIDFNNDFNVFGRNGYETVFTGWIDENTGTATQRGRGGIAIAIKRVYQGRAKYIWLVPARLAYLAQLRHPNLVRLVGYCLKEEPRLLVSECMPFGSLEDHLFKEDSQQLSWNLRMKIALGAAKGLAFLHNAETEVVHGDFKPSNVLLDLNYNARVSDFGLAMDSPRAYSVEAIYGDVEIGLNFLNGYTAPECLDSGDLTPKSDVYSFGVVLLEMLFSRRIVNKYSKPLGTEHIEVKTAKHCLNKKRKLFGALNCSFDGQYAIEIPQKAATLALKCLSMQANSRPTMNEVVRALEMI